MKNLITTATSTDRATDRLSSRRLPVCVGLIVIFLAWGSQSALAQSALAETEPNDSALVANAIVYGDTVHAAISPTHEDRDYYRFSAALGDTVQILITDFGNSVLGGNMEFYDSTGQMFYPDGDREFGADREGFVNWRVPHAGNFYIRVKSIYSSFSAFPNSVDQAGRPVIRPVEMSLPSTASPDTGEYLLHLRRFAPSAARVRYAYNGGAFSDCFTIQCGCLSNGLTTSLVIQYGTTSGYGNTQAVNGSPFVASIYTSSSTTTVTGLTPGTVHHYRVIATNAEGADTSQDFSVTTADPPQGWARQAGPTLNAIRAVSFQSLTRGTIASYQIYRTFDGGISWTNQFNPSGYWPGAIAFTDTSNGVVVGDYGSIMRTTDGGNSWNVVTSGTTETLRGVRLVDANNGFIAGTGGTILRTTNAGVDWERQSSGTPNNLNGISASDAQTATAVGENGTIVRTVNGGSSWIAQSSGTGKRLADAWFFDVNVGVIVGSDAVLRTTNGGSSWTNVSDAMGILHRVWFSDTNNGIAVGEQGRIARSVDGGRTWTAQSSGTVNSLYDVVAAGYNDAMAVGDNGTILTSVDIPPLAPENLRTTPGTGEITLRWNPAREYDILRHRIYYGTSPAPTTKMDSTTGGVGDTSITIPGLSVQRYYFRITAVDSAGYESPYSNEVSAIPVPDPPTPQNLIITYLNGQVSLKWNKVADSYFQRYIIFRSTSAGASARFDSTTFGNTDTARSYSNLTVGTRHYFRVTAQNSYGGESPYSNEVSVFVARNAISEIEPNDVAGNAMSIFYGDTVNGAISPTFTDKDYYKFFAANGDTARLFVSDADNSMLAGYPEFFDSTGQMYYPLGRRDFRSGVGSFVIWEVPFSGNFYVRIRSQANSFAPFPNSPVQGTPPVIQPVKSSIASDASPDTGGYRLLLEHFVPSAPVVEYANVQSVFSSEVALNATVYPNGLSTSVVVQYGTSASYGNTATLDGSPVPASIYPQGPMKRVTGLTPNTTYHYRVIAANAAGADTSGDNLFLTAPAPFGWTSRPSPTPNDIQAVSFQSMTKGTIVHYAIFRTTDGGDTWTNQNNPTGNWLRSLAFTDTATGVAVGEGGTIIRTIDGGSSWAAQSSGTTQTLWKVSLVDADHGFVVGGGGSILTTTNAGSTWTARSSGTTDELRGVSASDQQTATAVGVNGTILRTVDGGSVWSAQSSGTTHTLYDVWYFDANTGVAVGENVILRTSDAGSSWTTVSNSMGILFRVWFSDSNSGIAVGDQGKIARSVDGGRTWFHQSSGTTNTLWGIVAGSYNKAIAVGNAGTILTAVDMPPSAPASLTAIPASGQITLKWNSNKDYDFQRYRIYAGTVPSPTVKTDSTNAGNRADTSRTYGGLDNGTRYYFHVTAVDSGGYESGNSNEIGVYPTPPPAAPANLTATFAAGQVTLKWNRNTEGNFNRYLIYGGTAPLPTFLMDSTAYRNRLDTSKTFSSLALGKMYYFRITAEDTVRNQSQFSNMVWVKTWRPAFAEVEPNNDTTHATPLVYGDTVVASINPSSDIDYYRFLGMPGDTVEVFGRVMGTSTLTGNIYMYDSLGNQFINWPYYFYPGTAQHNAVRLENSARTYFLRVHYGEDWSTSFPNAVSKTDLPVIRQSANRVNTVASTDTGSYQINIGTFQPSPPEVDPNPGVNYVMWDSASVSTSVNSWGSNTMVICQYGLTTSYGSTLTFTPNPLKAIYPSYLRGTLTGLSPNTAYHIRIIATNAFGADTSLDQSFTTPGAPAGWAVGTSPTSNTLFGISFPSDEKGTVVGHEIYRTTNGGNSWTYQNNPSSCNWFYGVAFADTASGVAVGDNGTIIRTTNGGSNWTTQSSGSSQTLWAARFVGGTTGYVVGYSGTILRTTDGGASWSTQTSGTTRNLHSIYFSDSQTGTVVGSAGTILRTTDGGTSWNVQTSPVPDDLGGVWFFDANVGVIVGNGCILRTTNAGGVWELTREVPAALNRVSFSDANSGIAVGSSGAIYRTADGGRDWFAQSSGVGVGLFDVAATSYNRVMVVGDYGILLKAVDLPPAPPRNLAAIPDSGRVTISWNRSADYDFLRYRVFRDTTEAPITQIDSTTGAGDTSRTYTGLTLGTRYYFRIAAVDSGGNQSGYSNEVNIVPVPAPHAPTNLTATLVSSQVALKWNKVADGNFRRYLIYRGTSPQPKTKVDSTLENNAEDTTKVIPGLVLGTRYYFRITAQNIYLNESQYSNEVNVFVSRPAFAETEPDDSALIAIALVYGDTVNASIMPSTDKDYYKFSASQGDTAIVEAHTTGGSSLYGTAEVFDSLGNGMSTYGMWSQFTGQTTGRWIVMIPSNGTYYVRIRYANASYTNFPNSPSGGGKPGINPVRSQISTATTTDTGSYQLRLRLFTPPPPQVNDCYHYNLNYSSVTLRGGGYGNGLAVSMVFQYGTSTGYGNTVPLTGSPFGTTLTSIWSSADVSGLVPGTMYYYRMIVTTSAGADTSAAATFTTPIQPDANWSHRKTGYEEDYRGVRFFSKSTGVVVGARGARTTDGGASWTTTYTGNTMHDVCFVDSLKGYAPGWSTVYKTTDGGLTWGDPGAIISSWLYGVSFVDSSNGLAVGGSGAILKTTNGGATWTQQTSGTTLEVSKVKFVSSSVAYAVGGTGLLLKSTDGGTSWNTRTAPTTNDLTNLWFFDASNGFIASHDAVYKTSDGGSTWTPHQFGVSRWIWAISFSDASHGIAAGADGVLFRTIDGGATWNQEQTGTFNNLFALWVGGFNRVAAAGGSGLLITSIDIPPTTPANFSVVPAQGQVTLRWNRNPDYDFLRYRIYQAITPAPTTKVDSTLAGARADTTRTLTGLNPGLRYYFRITAVDSGGYESTYSREVAVTPTAAPAAPKNLAALFSQGQLTLRWSSNTEANFSRYIIYRGTSPQPSTPIDSTSVALGRLDTSRTYTGLTIGVHYFFRVTALNTAPNESQYSNEVTVTPWRPPIAENEANDSAAIANVVLVGDTVQSAIRPINDVDYYRFYAAVNDTVEFFVSQGANSSLNPRILVYDSTGWTPVYNTGYPVSSRLHSQMIAPHAGNYYARISYVWGNWLNYPFNPPAQTGPVLQPASMNSVTANNDTGAYVLVIRRYQPSSPDIAYTSVGAAFSNSAVLTANLSPNGASTTVTFQYGTTSGYGKSVSSRSSPFDGMDQRGVTSLPMLGLLPNTTYHYQVTAANLYGTMSSGDLTFSTPPSSTIWNLQSNNKLYNEASLSDVVQTGPATAYVASQDNTILTTTNGGGTWTSHSVPLGVTAMAFFSSTTGLAVGYSSQVFRTTDGGGTWTGISTTSYNSLQRVQCVTNSVAVAVGGSGTILRSTDAGLTWIQQTSPSVQSLYGVSFSDVNTGMAVGDNGTILRTTNGGSTWNAVVSGYSDYFTDIWLFDASNAVVADYQSKVLRTTDGGASWTSVTNNIVWGCRHVWFSDRYNGYLVGSGGTILTTTDGGATWSPQASGAYVGLWGVSSFGRSTFVVGDYGTILSASSPLAETEPNNLLTQATQIGYGDIVNARINPVGDVDYYVLRASAGDTLEIYGGTVGASGFQGTVVVVDSVTGNILRAAATPGLATQHLEYPIQTSGNYYILYESFLLNPTPSDTGSYQIRVKRFSPSTPDIEYTASPRSIFSGSAALSATVYPNGAPTTVYFEFGPNVSYGNRIDLADPFTGIAEASPVAFARGLAQNKTYHYRAVATNIYGAPTFSPDFTFTTPAAPEGWLKQQPPSFDRVNGLSFTTSSTGTAVGYSGTIAMTVDAGQSWQLQSSPTGQILIGVCFPDITNGFAVGRNGTILRTTNRGTLWTQQSAGTAAHLRAVSALNAETVLTVGTNGTILSTTNGGSTWRQQNSGVSGLRLSTVAYVDAANAFVGGDDGTLLRTTDGGTSWASVVPPTSKTINGLWAFNPNALVIVGDGGLIMKSTDGGIGWSSTTLTANDLYAVRFADANNGTIVGAGGAVLRSTDGGDTWKLQSSGTFDDLACVASVQPDTVIAAGNFGTVIRYIRETRPPSLAPVLAYPADNSVGKGLTDTLVWNGVSSAVTYKVHVATDQTFSSNIVFSDSTIVDTMAIIPGLNYSTKYYWHVGARNTVGLGPYSVTRSFTTVALPAPAAPVLAFPANNARNQPTTPRLQWYASPFAMDYEVQVSTSQLFGVSAIVFDTTIVDTTVAVTTRLGTGTTYYWRVKARNSSGSNIASSQSFITTTASFEVVTERANLVSTSTAILIATVNPKGSNTNVYFDWGTTTNYGSSTEPISAGSGNTSVTITDTLRNLSVGVVYHHRAVAQLVGSSVYVNGSDQAFQPGLSAPQSPGNLMSTLNAPGNVFKSVTLNWSDVLNEDGYTVDRRLSAGQYSQIALLAPNTTSYVDSLGLLTDSTYYYRVSGFNLAGTTYSDSVRVVTKLVPIAAFACKLVDFGSREISYDTYDSAAVVRNGGAGILQVTTPAITGPDASQFMILMGGDSYSELTGGTTKQMLIRFAPTSIGDKVAYLKIITNDLQQGTPPGTVLDTLRGVGVDSRAPISPVYPGIDPLAWSNSATFRITWQGPSDPSGIVALWYRYDTAPTADSAGIRATATTGGASGQAFIDAPQSSGHHIVHLVLEDGAGNKNVEACATVPVKFDKNPPTVSIDTNSISRVNIVGTSVTSPANFAITASAQKNTFLSGINPATFQLQYKHSGDASFSSTAFSSVSSGTAQIPTGYFIVGGQPVGVELRATANDSAGNTSTTKWYSVGIDVHSAPLSSIFIPSTSGYAADNVVSAYRMVSVPYNLSDRKPSTIVSLSNFGAHQENGINYANWRMQKVSANGGSVTDYEDFKDEQFFAPGAAAFLIMKSPKAISVGTGSVVRVDSMNIAGLPLATGWNLVGNPFQFNVLVDSLKVTGGTIDHTAYYNGTGGTSGWEYDNVSGRTLRTWEGLAVHTTGTPLVRFELPQTKLPGLQKFGRPELVRSVLDSAAGGKSWLIRFDAVRNDNGMRQENTTIGMVEGASAGRDMYDWPVPPMVGTKNVAVYFRNPDDLFVRDIRPVNADGEVWEMRVVTGDRAARIRLMFAEMPSFGNQEFRVFLIDLDEKMAYDLKERPSVEFNSREGVRTMRIVVGTRSFVENNSGGVDLLPKTMTLFQNYPNPFNPETIIRYTVPDAKASYKVVLKVYNILGQEVATVVDADQKAGYYEAPFSGKGLSSGTYIYRISVSDGSKDNSFTAVKKMLFVK